MVSASHPDAAAAGGESADAAAAGRESAAVPLLSAAPGGVGAPDLDAVSEDVRDGVSVEVA